MAACLYCKVNEDAPNAVHHFACPHGTNAVQIVKQGGADQSWPDDADGIFELPGAPYEWVATKVGGYTDQ